MARPSAENAIEMQTQGRPPRDLVVQEDPCDIADRRDDQSIANLPERADHHSLHPHRPLMLRRRCCRLLLPSFCLVGVVLLIVLVIVPLGSPQRCTGPSGPRAETRWRDRAILAGKESSIVPLAGIAVSPTSRNDSDPAKLLAIRAAFTRNIDAYASHAWGCDVLKPVSARGANPSDKLGRLGYATILDALPSMVVLGLEQEGLFQSMMVFVRDKVDFGTGRRGMAGRLTFGYGTVSVFEATIRYLGSLVSMLDSLHVTTSYTAEYGWLMDKAESLAQSLLPAFAHDIPYNKINLYIGKVYGIGGLVSLASPGTLVLEWGRLSQAAGNRTYHDKAAAAQVALMNAGDTFPGLQTVNVYPTTGRHSGAPLVTLGPGGDSYYEYLVKEALYQGNIADRQLLNTFKKMTQSARDHLIIKTQGHNLTFLADYRNGPIYKQSQLTCFIGGVWIMAGRMLNDDPMTTLGLEVTESCAETFLSTASGLGPKVWTFKDAAGNLKGVDASKFDASYYDSHGFDVDDATYIHGPEVVESIFYAWRITGQTMWRDMQWRIFQSLERSLSVGRDGAWGQYKEVRRSRDCDKLVIDEQDSYLYAELFKYLYLTFTDSSYFSLDQWVFNTEGHPLRLKPNKERSQYGSVQADKRGAL